MQFSTSSFHVFFFFFFFFFFFLLCNYISSLPTSQFKPILLPLKIMETPPAGLLSIKPTSLQTSALQSSPPPPSNRLLFKYNFSLVVSLQAGTPPQQVSMAIDTGSELSWLNCRPSTQTSCFSPTRSSTYRPVSCDSATCRNRTRDLPSPATCDPTRRLCRFSAAYADASSADGTLADETLTLGQLRRQFVIGCVESSFDSSSAAAATTGLLGMNRGQLSFISQLGIPKFSYCISDRSSAGFLLLGGGGGGGIPALNYTPFVSISLPLPYFDRVAYSVQLEGIRVGAKILPLPKSVFEPDHTGAGQTMVDSGTQFTLLLGPVYKALKNEYLERTRGFMRVYEDPNYVFQGAFDLCYRLASNKPLPEIPSVALVFRGAEVVVSGGRLLYKVPDKDGVHCFTFGNSDLVPVESYIIGHHHQQNTWVEYDLAGSRIGFAPAKCDAIGRQLKQQLRERV